MNNYIALSGENAKSILGNMPSEYLLDSVAEFFSALGDYTRIRVLATLSLSDMCVCDIAKIVGASQSAVSHQLKTLKAMKIVTARRDGKIIYYSVSDHIVSETLVNAIKYVNKLRKCLTA